ncbi:MAG: hypothetical protein QM621_08595 [Aeromicrobium sp.]|uniref:hypothetical protein n=1 Tax=Aeromicrobium sp. TaxID=1871063 RepID=UPI0039E2EB82
MPGSSSEVVCPGSDPESRELSKQTLSGSLPPFSGTAEPVVLAYEMENGVTCDPKSTIGARGSTRTDGYMPFGSCQDNPTWMLMPSDGELIDQTDDGWFVEMGESSDSPTERVEATTVFYMGSPTS